MSDLSAYQEAMRLGHAYAWDLKWEAASRQYRLALGERPGDPSATLSLAVALERMGDLVAAREMYEEAQRLLPDHAPVLQSLAELQLRLEDHAAAATSYVLLATLYLDQAQPRRAEDLLRRLVDLPEPDERALCALRDAAERAAHPEILRYAQARLARLPEQAAPASREEATADPVASPRAELPGVAAPEPLPREIPPAVQGLLETLETRIAPVPAWDEQVAIEAAWCPLPTELITVSAEHRPALAVALYETADCLAARQIEAARDRCSDALGLVSDFLPVHVQFARIDVAAGEQAMAAWRLRAVADLYEARGQLRQAARVWEELGELIQGPEAVDATVIDLLVRDGAPQAAALVLQRAALRCLAESRLDEAIRQLERALALCPEAIDLGLWRSRLLVEAGQPIEAAEWLDQALAATTGRGDPRLQLVRTTLAARAGQWEAVERAIHDWDTLPAEVAGDLLGEAAAWGVLQGGSDLVWYLAAQILRRAGHLDDAERCYRRALEVADAPATIQLALARLAAERGNWQEAARWLTLCLDGIAGPDRFARIDEALVFLLEVGERLEDDRLRARALARLIERHPDDVDRYPPLAESLIRLGDRAGARQQLQRLAEVYDRRGEPIRALAAEQAAASLPPLEPASQLRLARRFLAAGRYDDAVVAFEQVCALEDAAGTAELSETALRALIDLTSARDPRRALGYRVQRVRLSQSEWAARQELATAYLRDGRLRHALAEVQSLARQLSAAGHWTAAADYYREAVLLDPWDTTLLAEAAHALEEAGERDEALALVQRLRERSLLPPDAAGRGNLG